MFLSLLNSAGWDPELLRIRARHKNIYTTLNTYVHPSYEEKAESQAVYPFHPNRREKMLKLREEPLAVEEDRIAGRSGSKKESNNCHFEISNCQNGSYSF
ncbi:hypothetical protein [Enterocloster clostridioformis]|uniref:hypothetical protein n=1 Tax=Enterocloster clostridioformis TaxID=1531 RepID=UPI0032BFDA06